MNHKIHLYINKRLQELGWADKDLVESSNISKGQISKLKNGEVDKLTAETYYKLYKAFKNSSLEASSIVFGEIVINPYKPIQRNKFGKFMLQFEESKNSIEEISRKTGITEIRLKELYFKKGALEAYELLLIEKAIGEEEGYLFEEFYGSKI